ncbi:flagellar protein FlgN [Ornithinibacillus massiliensis]|uniref:Flagellar protein FlgN n=1 Tax=Ornithinibacillus massiliensis TaxID=1944633 RepID=A0ABS5MHB8_9BACI|nr:flagellar protein FlgN [Ornithinibacillus massiliensis]
MSVQAIIEKLEKLIVTHEQLLDLSKEKTAIVKEGNVENLQTVLIKERKILQQITQLEESRQKEVEDWFANHRLTNEEATVTNLVNQLSNNEERKAIEESAVRLTETIVNLKQQEQLNMALIQQSMQFVQLSIDLLSPSLKNLNYGKEQEQSQINRSVFDSKA